MVFLGGSRCEMCQIVYQGLKNVIGGSIPDDPEYKIWLGKNFTVHFAYRWSPPTWAGFYAVKFFCGPSQSQLTPFEVDIC